EGEMSPLIVGILGHELFEIILLLRGFAIRSRLIRENKQLLPFRSLVCQADRPLLMLEEVLRHTRCVCPRQFCRSKLRIERNSEIKMSQGVLGKKLVLERPTLHTL